MERAAALARLYESVNSIPEDIQQCLLQVAQYGCDPEQVKRWYLLVREHFGAPGSSLPPNIYAETAFDTTDPSSMETTLPLQAQLPFNRSTRTSYYGSVSSYASGPEKWHRGEAPQTPTAQLIANTTTNPGPHRSRADSGHVSRSNTSPDRSTHDPQMSQGTCNLESWDDFVHSPESVLGSVRGQSPSLSEPENMYESEPPQPLHSDSPSRYGFTMTSAAMPLLVPFEGSTVSGPFNDFNPVMSTTMPPPHAVQLQTPPPPSMSVIPSSSTRNSTGRRRRAPRKSVRELMEEHQLRKPRRPQTRYRQTDVVFELPMQPHIEHFVPIQPALQPDRAFLPASGVSYPTAHNEATAPQHHYHQDPFGASSSSRPGAFPQSQIVPLRQHSQQNPQESQSCPLPQHPFPIATNPYPAPYYNEQQRKHTSSEI